MDDKLREAFDQIKAENELKQKTKDFIMEKTRGYTRVKLVNYRRFASAFVCIALLLMGARWLYFTPTVEISIDINPSIELGVNRFDRVVSLESYNDDGKSLVDSLNVKFMNYSDAVNQIIESEDIVSLLSNDEVMTIAVIGWETEQFEEIFSTMQSCTVGKRNVYCYSAQGEEVEDAHKAGLSYGKYKAFLEVQELDPNITVSEIQHMTMREIRKLIDELSQNGEKERDSSDQEKGRLPYGNRNRRRQGRGNGRMNAGGIGSQE